MSRHETQIAKSARRDDCRGHSLLYAAVDVHSHVCGVAAVRPGHVPKAETLRETAYAFCAGLYPQEKQAPAWQTEKTGQSFTFSAGAGAGTFTVDGVELDQVETQAEVSENGGTPTTETHTFHRYAKEAGEATS